MTFLPGRLSRSGDRASVALDGGPSLGLPPGRGVDGADGRAVILGVRPEHIARAEGPSAPAGRARIDAVVEFLQPTGSRTYATFRIGNTPVMAELEAHDAGRPGDTIPLDLNLDRVSLFDAGSRSEI